MTRSTALVVALVAPLAVAPVAAQVRVVEPLVVAPSQFILRETAFDSWGGRVLAYDWPNDRLMAAASGTATWVPLPAAPNQPSRRLGALRVFDDVRGRLVVFGGLVAGTGGGTDETWEFDGVAWQQRFAATRPPARHSAHGCFRGDHGTVLMFGGTATSGGNQLLSDTWEYDGSNWQQVAAGGLTAPTEVALAADLARGTVVAYSGVATHELRASGWVTVQPTVRPTDRTAPGLGYDPRRSRCVLFGGRDLLTGAQLADFWEFDGTTWLQRIPVPAPLRPRFAAQMHYDSTARALLGVGGSYLAGNTVTQLADVLRYEPTVAAESLSFGSGCPGQSGIAELTSSELPWLGRTIRLEVAVPASAVALLVVGLSNTQHGGLPLPQSLAAVGMQGCQQLVSVDAVGVAVGGASGVAAIPLSIPNAPALLAVELFAQAAIPGSTTSLGMVTTAGRHLVIGSF